MTQGFFIAGTDTEVGKTHFVCQWLAWAAANNMDALPYKPVAAGLEPDGAGGWQQPDVEALYRASRGRVSRADINPVLLPDPVSPHIAAAKAGLVIDVASLVNGYQQLARQTALVLVEGAGGWLAPINDSQTMADLAAALQLPVVMVVGVRLGCLNHALLTARQILADGLHLAGWVANPIQADMPAYQDNITTLKARLPAPLLAELEFPSSPCEPLRWEEPPKCAFN
jgi:dethiobiotin synthetase